MQRCLLATLLALAAAAHDEHIELSFAETVQLIARASREGFRPLKTFRIEMHPSRDYWYNVTNALPGASTCRIFEHPKLIYKCEWSRGARTPTSLAGDIGAALGSAWKRVDALPSFIRFEPVNPVRDTTAEVRQRASGLEVVFYRPLGRDGSSGDDIK